MPGKKQCKSHPVLIFLIIIAALIGVILIFNYYERNNRENIKKNTICRYEGAILTNKVDEVKAFLEKDSSLANVKITSNNSFGIKGIWVTPLCDVRSPEMAELLIKNGADVNAKNSFGATPLNLLSSFRMPKTLQFLISKGAEVNTQDNEGWTPLHHAANSEEYENVKVLIESGADVNARTPHGLKPYHLARRKNLTKIMDLLRKHGAKE